MVTPRASAPVPNWLYGTAWKEEATEGLVLAALDAGFRGFDTANQRKHYFEAALGRAITTRITDGSVARAELFLQSKFTFVDGQDHRLPYDPRAPIAEQVAQSFASSLEHLGVDFLDSYILHGPSQRDGLGDDDRAAWTAMEALAEAGRAARIGISNVTLRQLKELCAIAKVAPLFVQNRCYADRGWDREVRAYCHAHQIIYQGFSLLTANRQVVTGPSVRAIAKRHEMTPEQIVFRFCQQRGMLPLTGTSDPKHMRNDLSIDTLHLDESELAAIEGAAR